MKHAFLLSISLLLVPPAEAQAPNCWAANVAEPMSNDGLRHDHPSCPLNAALDVVEAMLRPNPGLLALPEVRLRFHRQIMDALHPGRMPREASIHAHGFGPKAWGRGDCEVIPQASRLGARAGVDVFLNVPTVVINRWEYDEQLTTYLEAEPSPSFKGWPTYRECAVLSKDRRLPWIPVQVGEMLDYFARDQQRKIERWDLSHERKLQPYDLAAAEREAERIRPLNAKAAEALLMAARQRKEGEARNFELLRRERQHLAEELASLRATRAAMDPSQLAEPYRLGTGKHRLPTAAELRRAGPRIVKLDPDFPWDGKNRGRIQLITVCAGQLERNPHYHPAMREALAAIDFERLARLLN